MKLRVGLDLDGVLYSFGDSVIRYLESIDKHYEFKAGADEPHTWNFYEHWGMTAKEFVKHCDDGVDAGIIFQGPARPNAVETCWKIYDQGHDLVVMTDRKFGSNPFNSRAATLEWWERNDFPPFADFAITADKTFLPTDVYVEDKLEHYDALVAHGTPCALITRPWNFVLNDGRYRISDISEYPDVISDIFVPIG